MKSLAIGLLVLALAPAGTAFAGHHDGPSISLKSCCDSPTRLADRWESEDIRTSIRTEDGSVDLLLADGVVAIQLSDRSMRKVSRKLHEKEFEEEDNALARAIKVAVIGSVREMLDHSIECRIRDVRSVDYRNGRLVILSRDGDRIFDGIEIDDQNVLECFSDRDARAFVAEFQRVKGSF